jgi:two-component system response regulator NreC
LINSQTDLEVVGEAENGRDAVRLSAECALDVAVVDVSLPDVQGFGVAAQIRQHSPHVKILALTRHADEGYLRRMLSAGATGYALKKSAADELINAIRVVAAGGTYIEPTLVEALTSVFTPHARSSAMPVQRELTARETQVLRALAWGKSNKEIAADLAISVKTVEYHKAKAGEKLGLRTRTDILRHALAQGWLRGDVEPE